MARFYSLNDITRAARRRMPRMMFDFVEGAAGTEGLVERNESAIKAVMLQPRVMVNVEQRDLATGFLGANWDLPFGIAPMGMCNLAWPGTDAAFARAAQRHNIPVCLSTAGSTSIETMREQAGENAWFQLYVVQTDELTFSFIDRAKHAGYDVLVFTVDVPEVAPRVRDQRNGFQAQLKIGPRQFLDFATHPNWSVSTLAAGVPRTANFPDDDGESSFVRTASRARVDWEYLARVRDAWPGKLVVKGVVSVEDAVGIQKAGVDAIYVSNHGGRQLESGPPAIDALPRIRAAVGPDFPLLFDSGIRSGEGIAKALALGADFVMMGRPFMYAAGAGGEVAIDRLVDILRAELDLTLAQLGKTTLHELDESALFRA